jgi:uncharacterized protein (UPF0332 family)
VTEQAAGEHIAVEMARARSLRDAAAREMAAGLPDRAASTLYFAAVHACRALLASIGIEPRSHRGLRSLVSLRFVKTGRLDPEAVRALSDLQEAREGSDYIASFTVSEEECSRLAEKADAILAEVERVLSADPRMP